MSMPPQTGDTVAIATTMPPRASDIGTPAKADVVSETGSEDEDDVSGCAEPETQEVWVPLSPHACVVQASVEEAFPGTPRLSPNIMALSISAFLFALITVVQMFAAKIAHSQALLMDCISMGVDALTYLGNIVVECRKQDGGKHEISQLFVVAASLSCLVYFTVEASLESWGTIQVCMGHAEGSDADADDVNGWITLAFALGGLAFDLVCLWAFYKSNKKTGGARHVNMFSALLHVGADFLRSTSTLVMSLLILGGGFDSTCLDAYTSVLIGATILVGAMSGFWRWVKLLASHYRGEA